jgi:hypothetical protein
MQPGATQPDRAQAPTPPLTEPTAPTRAPRQPRAFGVLRILLTVLVALILLQAITAGQLLAGTPGWRAVHAAGAMLILLVALAQVVAAILIWRPGRGGARMVGPTVGILVVMLLQAYLGDSHNRAIHIPLGVLLFGGLLGLMRQLWSGGGRGPARLDTQAPSAADGQATAAGEATADGETA